MPGRGALKRRRLLKYMYLNQARASKSSLAKRPQLTSQNDDAKITPAGVIFIDS